MAEVIVVEQSSWSTSLFWGLGVFFFVFFILIPLIILIFSDVISAESTNNCTNCEANNPILLQSQANSQYISNSGGTAALTGDSGSAQRLILESTDSGDYFFSTNNGLVLGGRNGQIFIDSPSNFSNGTWIWSITSNQIISAQQQDFVLAVVDNQLVYQTLEGLPAVDYTWTQVRV